MDTAYGFIMKWVNYAFPPQKITRLSSCEANTECKKNISSFIFLDKKKKKKKQTERRSQPVGPQIIEYPAGTTSIPLAEAQLLLGEIDNMKGDGKYDSLAEFLSQLLQKIQNLETGNYSRTEIQLCVRQFQDYNEGFHYRMESKPRG